VRRALELPEDDDAGSVEPAARQLFATIPVQTLPLVSPDASGHVQLCFEDLPMVPSFGIDLGARRYGYGLCPDGASITGRAATLIMVAAGRDRWRDAEEAGLIAVAGERGPAEALLDVLRAV